MRELVTNCKNTFVFMKGHRTKYSLGIIGMTVMRCTAAIITILVYLVPMFVMDYQITTALIVISTASMFVNVKMAAKIKALTKEAQERNSELTVILGNIIAGMSVIRIYQMHRKIMEQFSTANRQLSFTERKRAKMLCLLSVWQS